MRQALGGALGGRYYELRDGTAVPVRVQAWVVVVFEGRDNANDHASTGLKRYAIRRTLSLAPQIGRLRSLRTGWKNRNVPIKKGPSCAALQC
jgi:hypothetical protein